MRTSTNHSCVYLFVGPDDTPYATGKFLGFIQFSDDFPSSPPVVRMVTQIYHCNVNSDGKVCHSVLDRNWNRGTSIRLVFDCIYGLFLCPDPDDPLGMYNSITSTSVIAEMFYYD